jgi:hypothetical protein
MHGAGGCVLLCARVRMHASMCVCARMHAGTHQAHAFGMGVRPRASAGAHAGMHAGNQMPFLRHEQQEEARHTVTSADLAERRAEVTQQQEALQSCMEALTAGKAEKALFHVLALPPPPSPHLLFPHSLPSISLKPLTSFSPHLPPLLLARSPHLFLPLPTSPPSRLTPVPLSRRPRCALCLSPSVC